MKRYAFAAVVALLAAAAVVGVAAADAGPLVNAGLEDEFPDGRPVVGTEVQRHLALDVLPGNGTGVFQQLDGPRRDVDPVVRLGPTAETAGLLGTPGVHASP